MHKMDVAQSTQNRKDLHNNYRKAKKDNEALLRRNIDWNISPINTPKQEVKVSSKILNKNKNADVQEHPKKIDKKVNESTAVPNKRLELLSKWKMERAKAKQQNKARAKPIFKVFHVATDSFPSLENVNKVIKGKPIPVLKKSQFAPVNHVFRPPSGLKPIKQLTNPTIKGLTRQLTFDLSPQKACGSSKTSGVHCALESVKLKDHKVNPSTSKGTQSIVKEDGKKIPKLRVHRASKIITPQFAKNNPSFPKGTQNEGMQNKKTLKKGIKKIEKTKTPEPDPCQKAEDSDIINKNCDGNAAVHQGDTQAHDLEVIQESNIKSQEPEPCEINSNCDGNSSKQLEVTQTHDLEVTHKNYIKIPEPDQCDKAEQSVLINMSCAGNSLVHEEDTQIHDLEVTQENNIKACLRPRRKVKDDEKENGNTEIATPERYSLRKRTQKKSVLWNVSNTFETPSIVKPITFRKTPVRIASTSQSECQTSVDRHSTLPDNPIESSDLDKSFEFVKTPLKSSLDSTSPTLYISPFVTISRGKKSARNEFHRRSCSNNISVSDKYTSPKAGAKYFSNKLELEIERIELMCEEWRHYLASPDIPVVAIDSINVAIGQSKLLISKKFEQFRRLIDRCRINSSDVQTVTCQDLHGFWDMIYIQVEDIDKRFENLKRLKHNNWEEMLQQKPKTQSTKSRGRPKKLKKPKTSKIMEFIKVQKQKRREENSGNEIVVPIVASSNVKENSSLKRRSQRLSQLYNETNKRCSSSPSLTLMKISQAIKQGPNGLTPAKSILKSESTRSTGKKSVLFKES
ncbi:uncharacterized protein LOC132703994 isoform X2 [Cylas formicarius]|nr:uncharacterized protein LOC132703994 isoform X2 [Cylas formicarius]